MATKKSRSRKRSSSKKRSAKIDWNAEISSLRKMMNTAEGYNNSVRAYTDKVNAFVLGVDMRLRELEEKIGKPQGG